MLAEQAEPPSLPVVMTLAGHDPVGGAGIQADMEAIASQGCHPVSVITCLTVQDTRNVYRIEPVSDYLIEQQAEALLADMPVAAIKIGLLGSLQVVDAVCDILDQVRDIPIILDPVLAAGGGTRLADGELVEAMRSCLLPHVTLLTPNVPEARQLAQCDGSLDEQACALLACGCDNVLLTGTHAETAAVENILFAEGKRQRTWNWERLAQTYHGSGCTLAAACAANLAKGQVMGKALSAAQAYTWGSLQAGRPLGQGQWLPNRFYWK